MIPTKVKQLIRTASIQKRIEPMPERLERKNSKTIYRKLNNKDIQRPTSERKLEEQYNVDNENW